MENVAGVLSLIGLLTFLACIVLLTISLVRKKSYKRWALGMVAGIILFIIGASMMPSNDVATTPSPPTRQPAPTPTPPETSKPTPKPVIPTSPPTIPTEPNILVQYFDDVTFNVLSTHEAISAMDDSVKDATLLFKTGANDTAYSILEDGCNEFILNVTKIRRNWDAITPPNEYSDLHDRYSIALKKIAEAHEQMLTAAIAHASLSASVTAVQNASDEMRLCMYKYDEALSKVTSP